jgi:hypothetical protein
VLGGRPRSRLSSRQKKPTSRMTLLRLVRALAEPAIETPKVLGVDEFAFRRGRLYGTIVIDGDDHHVIDLLADPSAEALVSWLTEHPGAAASAATEMASTPAPQGAVHQLLCRWPIVGTSFTTWWMLLGEWPCAYWRHCTNSARPTTCRRSMNTEPPRHSRR